MTKKLEKSETEILKSFENDEWQPIKDAGKKKTNMYAMPKIQQLRTKELISDCLKKISQILRQNLWKREYPIRLLLQASFINTCLESIEKSEVVKL